MDKDKYEIVPVNDEEGKEKFFSMKNLPVILILAVILVFFICLFAPIFSSDTSAMTFLRNILIISTLLKLAFMGFVNTINIFKNIKIDINNKIVGFIITFWISFFIDVFVFFNLVNNLPLFLLRIFYIAICLELLVNIIYVLYLIIFDEMRNKNE